MTFDEWVDAEFAIDNDPDGFEYRLAKRAWDACAVAEREACADICDQHASVEGIAQKCAETIRGSGDDFEKR